MRPDIIILLNGGPKDKQDGDIRKARVYLEEWKDSQP